MPTRQIFVPMAGVEQNANTAVGKSGTNFLFFSQHILYNFLDFPRDIEPPAMTFKAKVYI